MHSEELELAQIAYHAYGEAVGVLALCVDSELPNPKGQTTDFKNYQGLPMPKWENLSLKIQQAWIAAAVAVAHITVKRSTESLAKTIVDDVFESLDKENI